MCDQHQQMYEMFLILYLSFGFCTPQYINNGKEKQEITSYCGEMEINRHALKKST